MKRKFVTIILAFTGILIMSFAVMFFLGVFRPQEAGIEVKTDPVATVFINGQEVGKTPLNVNREPGEITVRIKPDDSNDEGFDDYETKITLVSGVKTVIERNFKPNDKDTNGAIVSFEKLSGDESLVTVVSVPDNAQITIDGKVYGYAPLRVNIPAGDHELLVKSDKYLGLKLPIRVFKGYKLTASVKLARSNEPEATPPPVLSENIENKEKIEILANDVGFLRVRKDPSISSPEVAQVKPGQTFEVLETNDSQAWYKIEVNLTSEGSQKQVLGWVAKDFVKLLNTAD